MGVTRCARPLSSATRRTPVLGSASLAITIRVTLTSTILVGSVTTLDFESKYEKTGTGPLATFRHTAPSQPCSEPPLDRRQFSAPWCGKALFLVTGSEPTTRCG